MIEKTAGTGTCLVEMADGWRNIRFFFPKKIGGKEINCTFATIT